MSYFNYNDFQWDVSNLLDEACDTAKDNVRYEVDSAIESAFEDIDMESLLEDVWDKAQEEAQEDIEEEVRCAKDEMWSTLCDYFTNPLAEDPKTVFSKYNADEFIEKAMKDILSIRVGDEVVFIVDDVKYHGVVIQIFNDVEDGGTNYRVMDVEGNTWIKRDYGLTRTGRAYTQLIDIFKGLAEPFEIA